MQQAMLVSAMALFHFGKKVLNRRGTLRRRLDGLVADRKVHGFLRIEAVGETRRHQARNRRQFVELFVRGRWRSESGLAGCAPSPFAAASDPRS